MKTEPSIHIGMPNATYHALPAVGSSGLKLLQRSPAHYFAAYRDPARKQREATPAMKIGTAWHAAIFEPEAFAAEYVEIPDGLDRRTKEGKALWAELEASGRTPMAPEAYADILAMRASAAAHPVSKVVFGLPAGAAELSMFWTDAETGVPCKIRPDYSVPPCEQFPHGLVIDGKTGEDMSPAGFGKYAWNWDLHLQAAYYSDGFQTVYGTTQPPAYAWLAQEKEAPFACAYYDADATFLEYGRRLYRPALRKLSECLRTDTWPAYGHLVQPLALPAWAEKQVADGVAA